MTSPAPEAKDGQESLPAARNDQLASSSTIDRMLKLEEDRLSFQRKQLEVNDRSLEYSDASAQRQYDAHVKGIELHDVQDKRRHELARLVLAALVVLVSLSISSREALGFF